MGKKLRSFLSMLLAMAMILGLVPMSAMASAAENPESKTHAITVSVVNSEGAVSGMYAMDSAIVTEQEDGTYLVRMHQTKQNRNYLAIVPDNTSDSVNLATNHLVDWYISGGDGGYWYVIPVKSLDETLYASFSKTESVEAGKAWGNVQTITFDTASMADTAEADVTAEEMNVSAAIPAETETALTASASTAMFKAVSGSIVKNRITGEVYLRVALSGTGCEVLMPGTYEEAVASTSGDTADQSNWINYTVNDAGKYEFLIPIEEGQTIVLVQSLSASSAKQGIYKWFPRQFVIDYDNLTVVSGDYEGTDELTEITDDGNVHCGDIVSAEVYSIAGPASNNYKYQLILHVAEDFGYETASIYCDEMTEPQTATLGEDNTFRFTLIENQKGGTALYDYLGDDMILTLGDSDVWNLEVDADALTYNIYQFYTVQEYVFVNAQADGAYLLPAEQDLTVSSDTAESYGYTDNIDMGQVSALDVLVAAHEEMYGSDFTVDTASDYLAVSDMGYVSKLFGVETYANGFLVNGGYPNDGTESTYGGYNGTTVNSTVVTSLDTVDFFTYSDTAMYSDYYTYVEAPESAEVGTNIDVTVEGVMVMAGYQYETPADFADAAAPLEGAGLAWVDIETGAVSQIVYSDNKEDVLTDENGCASITVPEEPGEYYLTAYSNTADNVYVIMNTVSIEVTEETALPFVDVAEGTWYYDAVKYVYANGYMTGKTDTVFSPTGVLSRAQFATIIWRMFGAVETEYTAKFPDVKDNQFYTTAVLWCSSVGIITGYDDGYFRPAKNITREQMAVMIYRYAKYISRYSDEIAEVIDERADLSVYPDAGKVSGFAKEAMEWCVAEGIISGKQATTPATLDPQGTAKRAECAAIIQRLDTLF